MDALHRRLTRGLIVVVMVGFAIIAVAAFFAPPPDTSTGLRSVGEFWGLYALLALAMAGVLLLFSYLIPKEERETREGRRDE